MLSSDYKIDGKNVPLIIRLQHLGENFGTRQGKSRDIKLEIPIKRINRWTK